MKLNKEPFHILFLPVFPILSLFAHNFGELSVRQLLPGVAFTLFISLTLWVVLTYFFTRNRWISAFIVSGTFFIFRPFNNIEFLLGRSDPFLLVTSNAFNIGVFISSLVIITLLSLRLRSKFDRVTRVVNIFSITLICIPLLLISYVQFKRIYYPIHEPRLVQSIDHLVGLDSPPDIYYLVFDRYANSETLLNQYKYNNSEFISFLESAGFYVASNSAANYPFTLPSLASSLNMTYLTDVAREVGRDSADSKPLMHMIEDNEVQAYLKSKNYHFVHIGSASEYTFSNRNADYDLRYRPQKPSEVAEWLDSLSDNPKNKLAQSINTSLRKVTIDELSKQRNFANHHLWQLLKLSEVTTMKGPKFVFLHSLLTHEPFVFSRDGKYTPNEDVFIADDSHYKRYTEQLVFTNTMIRSLIQTILEQSTQPPIIILQSDEGPFPKRYRLQKSSFAWRYAEPHELREKALILNAYFFPGVDTKKLYSTITPVNTFRFLFSHYFGEDLPLIEDRNYIPTYADRYYDNLIITEILR